MSCNLRPLDLQQHYIESRLFLRVSWSLWQRNKDPSLLEVESLSSPEIGVIPILLCCYLIFLSLCYKLLSDETVVCALYGLYQDLQWRFFLNLLKLILGLQRFVDVSWCKEKFYIEKRCWTLSKRECSMFCGCSSKHCCDCITAACRRAISWTYKANYSSQSNLHVSQNKPPALCKHLNSSCGYFPYAGHNSTIVSCLLYCLITFGILKITIPQLSLGYRYITKIDD